MWHLNPLEREPIVLPPANDRPGRAVCLCHLVGTAQDLIRVCFIVGVLFRALEFSDAPSFIYLFWREREKRCETESRWSKMTEQG